MMARLEGRDFQLPVPAISSQHHETTGFLSPVITSVSDTHIEVFAPLSAILNRKFQFHKLVICYKGTKKWELIIKSREFFHNFLCFAPDFS